MEKSDEKRVAELESKVAFLEKDLEEMKEATASITKFTQDLEDKIALLKRQVETPEVEKEE